jgi:CUB/sushi domain-containing protein
MGHGAEWSLYAIVNSIINEYIVTKINSTTVIAVNCGNLTDISNGSVTFSETTFGSIATYSCDEGFGLQGSTERVCETIGQWSGSEPSCISNQRGGREQKRGGEREESEREGGGGR